MNSDIKHSSLPTLPEYARLPINRCNLPPQILGGLTYQQHPVKLCIDGVAELHRQLYSMLDQTDDHSVRAARFMDYMAVVFRLHQLEDAGFSEDDARGRADYLHLLRGWLFNSDNREAAVLKGWVESRFGLVPIYHQGPLKDKTSNHYLAYQAARAGGLYGTNALESQLDLMYSYCQYELGKQYGPDQLITLFRGINKPDQLEVLQQQDKKSSIVLLNNLNAFSHTRERAEEFGDYIMEVNVPWQKILYYSQLLPNHHIGEDEYLLIGGVYRVSTQYW